MSKRFYLHNTMIAAMLLMTGGSAHAGLSFVVTDTATRTEAFNIAGFATLPIGSAVSLGHLDYTGPGSQTVTYTYLGQESGFVDKFYNTLSGTELLESNAVGTSVSSLVSTAGPLSFKFEGDAGKFAINGGHWDTGTSIGLIGTNMLVGSTTYAYVLGYNDSAGTKHLGDWDDFVIGVSAVPEPETYAMLLVGLGLVGFSLSKQRQR
ncbi:MAG: PEP-CTERM sorting domain-containing protein [Nitrosomonas sp.]|uniref:PEP-CTERM sorting domain-containing protein n=1 Tax=Nitrosomonas sp. TaxID=42353 RepID=UPI0025DF6059|nr:PEP-CTERM sorting domain-containing protein [Nitrosomonas sp.]MCG7756135.1 PEP-CTERM sorting domain-containing protein [Nitrosomonas sp.]UJO99678.1 MAG: PEP-CTERM sorting domain-containing protein [Nitrosomonas sp.]UJP01935.1 MAG: PEP-CTERM sorting domain-containing protein [Nitrosomonas sp.]UJP07651.1 MAG: PEP-CTERM sorting domain-containing protein [Nitrosomonas sp.]